MPDLKDLDVLKDIIEKLQTLETEGRTKIIKLACEYLGIKSDYIPISNKTNESSEEKPVLNTSTVKDIKTFLNEKNPSSESQTAVAIAYYYKFVSPDSMRKDSIDGSDLTNAIRLADRRQIKFPTQVLINLKNTGYFDKNDDGKYGINLVGENFVLDMNNSSKVRVKKKSSKKNTSTGKGSPSKKPSKRNRN